MLVSTKEALEKSELVKTLTNRLGDMPMQDKQSIVSGAATFRSLCASCHGIDGKGISTGTGVATSPSLAGSKYLSYAQKDAAIRILLHGLTGPIGGKKYSSDMPSMSDNNDRWIASVLSYARYEFGKKPQAGLSPIVRSEEVKKIREDNAGRNKAWTIKELENIK